MNYMKLFKWLTPPDKSDIELQSELKALVHTVTAKQYAGGTSMVRYEKLLKEIYKRGLKPESIITVKDKW